MAITDYPKSTLLHLYRQMYLVREFELRAINERRAGLIPGFIHSCVGQEATAVGACAALEPADVITSTHRGHGHLIAKGGEPKYMMAELAARVTGYCGGKGGSLHMSDFNLGILGANGIVAGGIPIAVGAALAFQQKKERRVALSFFGDGATNEGAFHEALNLAAVWKLPVVWVIENNQYGMGTAVVRASAVADLAKKAEAYGMPCCMQVDGMDLLALREMFTEAVEYARSGQGAFIVEAITYRYRGHSMGDPERYRSAHEVEVKKADDPITRWGNHLLAHKVATRKQLEALEQSAAEEVEAAVEFARNSPLPDPEELYTDVYV